MTDTPSPNLKPATPEDLEQALAYALRHDGKKAFKLSGESMARITAGHLVRYLAQSGYVVMKRPAAEVRPGCAYAESVMRVTGQEPSSDA